MFLLLVIHCVLHELPVVLHLGFAILRDLLAASLPILYDVFVYAANIIRAAQIYYGVKPKVIEIIKKAQKRVMLLIQRIMKPIK